MVCITRKTRLLLPNAPNTAAHRLDGFARILIAFAVGSNLGDAEVNTENAFARGFWRISFNNVMPIKTFAYSGHLRDEDANLIADLRRAGIQSDTTKVPALREALDNPKHVTYVYTALHSLSQMGITGALNSVDKIRSSSDTDLSHFAHSAKARLLAESKVEQGLNHKTRSASKVHIFYQELGLTPADINASVFIYRNPQTTSEGYGVTFSETQPTPVAVYAIREMADMIYRDSLAPGVYEGYMALPTVAAVDFSQDYASALKMRLAPLTQGERVAMLITELSNKKVLRAEDNYEIQLAINEGVETIPAINMKLKDMDSNRSRYSYIGFAALFRVLAGIGDPKSASLVESFLHDNDQWVVYYSDQVYLDLHKGIKHDRVFAY